MTTDQSRGGTGGGPPTNIEQTRRRSAELFSVLRDELASQAERDGARDSLVHLHLPLVEHCARRFRNRGEPYEDLVQVGTIGLIKSVDRFDTERGVEFSTYATPTIIGEIKRYFRDKGWAIRVPRRLQELRMQISASTAELTQSLGRSPTPASSPRRSGAPSRRSSRAWSRATPTPPSPWTPPTTTPTAAPARACSTRWAWTTRRSSTSRSASR